MNEEVNAVSSIELHEALDVKSDHSKWISRRIEELGLIVDVDFLLVKIGKQTPGRGGHNKIEGTHYAN